LYYLRDLRGKAAKIREKRDGVEGYGDGILSTPVAPVIEETPVASAPEAVAETVEAPAVAEPVAEAAVEEVAVAETSSDTETETK
jgi:hypothetical protein